MKPWYSFFRLPAFMLVLFRTVAVPASDPVSSEALTLGMVRHSVTNLYPPLLAALIERDIADGRLQSTMGAFDFQWFAKAFGTPAGYYESGTLDTGFEKFLGLWGSTLFGGYRLTDGDTLPDYRKERTQEGGEFRLGLKLPLLQDGRIDKRRADILKARYDRELADPLIQRQELDFLRASTAAYYGWLAAGAKLRLAEDQYRLAEDRMQLLQTQVESGLIRKLVLTDNRRLVVDRQIEVTRARRAFEAAGLTLSLFHRDADMKPVVSGLDRVPLSFPGVTDPAGLEVDRDIETAFALRPELRRIQIAVNKAGVDLEQARNRLRPVLDAVVVGSRDLGEERYDDLTEFELEAGVEFKLPLERREGRGDRVVAESRLDQLVYQEAFARERISTEILNARSALVASHEQIQMASLNVALAKELQSAEQELFDRGASDFLAVQLREQAAFSAQTKSIEALEKYFIALADYHAATVNF